MCAIQRAYWQKSKRIVDEIYSQCAYSIAAQKTEFGPVYYTNRLPGILITPAQMRWHQTLDPDNILLDSRGPLILIIAAQQPSRGRETECLLLLAYSVWRWLCGYPVSSSLHCRPLAPFALVHSLLWLLGYPFRPWYCPAIKKKLVYPTSSRPAECQKLATKQTAACASPLYAYVSVSVSVWISSGNAYSATALIFRPSRKRLFDLEWLIWGWRGSWMTIHIDRYIPFLSILYK